MSGINSNVVLLLHGDGADAATTIIDTAKGATVTVVGNTQIDTAQKKFGTGAILFDGLNDVCFLASNANFTLASNFTLDFWIRFATLPAAWSLDAQRPVVKLANASNRWFVELKSNTVGFYTQSSGVGVGYLRGSLVSLISTGEFYHFAVTCSGGTGKIFWNGSLLDTSIIAPPDLLNTSLQVGGDSIGGGYFVNGWIDELRIVKGVSMWDSSFTPPTEPYSPDIPVATLQITQETPTRIEKTFTTAAESIVITPIPYDASEHPAEINLSATATAGTRSVHTSNYANINFEGSALYTTPNIGDIDADLKGVTAITEVYLPTVSTEADGMVDIEGIVGHRVFNEPELSPITLVATARVSDAWEIKATLARIEGALSGNQEVLASLNENLEPITLSAESLHTNVVGSIDRTLHPIILKEQIHGNVGLDWSLSFTLPRITLSTTAVHDVHASLSKELSAIGAEIEIDSLVFEIIAMNLLNKAVTNFSNYPFNSFCYFNGKYFGCSRDGIYELTGVDDYGVDISAYVQTGLLDLEVTALQRIRHAYLGFKASGVLTLTITTDDDVSYSYTTENITTNNQGQKVKFGKGFKDRYIKLKIANTDGCTFSIDKTRLFDEPIAHRKR